MLLNCMTLLTFTLALVVTQSSTPVNLGIWIIMTTLTAAMTMSIPTSSWYPLILVLIYIGALLVMFAYFVSIQPNQNMGMSKMALSVLASLCILSPLPMSYTMPPTYEQANFLQIPELLLPTNIQILSMIVFVLFLGLIAVVKMTDITSGPLRPFK